MNLLALLMVLASAVSHATWNYLAKRTHGGAPFLWLTDALTVLFYAPLVAILFIVQRWSLSLAGIVLMVGSAVLHLAYFLLLQKGYRLGDLSLVYPLTRGTGPLLSTLGAIMLLGERPTPIALAGMLLVVVGLFLLTGGLRIFRASTGQLVLRYGTLSGLFIACYTLWDKLAVSGAHISPLLYNYGVILVRGTLLSPYALRHWHMVRLDWHEHRLEVCGVAVLSFLSYFLVLTALVFTPVSYIAPVREIGVLFGAILGIRLLAEREARRRLIAAGMIVVGIIVLAFS
jgi:drug/metabolite transporter (DMT)-like permease